MDNRTQDFYNPQDEHVDEQYKPTNDNSVEKPTEEPQEQTIKTNNYESPYSDIQNIKDDKDEQKLIVVPSGIYKEVKTLAEAVSIITEDNAEKYLNNDDKIALDIAVNGLNNTAPKGAFDEQIDTETWSQNLKVDDKTIGLRELKIKTDNFKGVLSGNKALAKLNTFLGLSNEVQITLWHSGFHITLGVLSESDIVDLSTRLAKQKIELGKNTNGLVFSNDNVLYTRIILEFVLEHIENTSLMLTDEDDIRDYILAPDIYNLAIGVLRSIEPSGFKISRTCRNAIQFDENTKPKCNFTLTATLNLDNVTYVDKDNMSTEHKQFLTKRSPNSVTKEEVIEYQNTLKVLQTKDIVIDLNGKNIILTLQVPNVLDNIEAGEMWISDITTSVEAQLANIDDVTENKRISMLSKMSKATLLNRYLHYVKSITLEDSIIRDKPTISEALNRMVSNDITYKTVAIAIMEFVDSQVISVIGLPQYACPNCKEEYDILQGNFKEIIPLNIYHTFLEICTLKVYELEKRTETT